jgi:ABC-type transporter MlaC component
MPPTLYLTCLRCAMMACCFVLGIMPSPLRAETPIQALQATLDRFQSILHDVGLREDSRQEQVLRTILARFDFREMSKRILGPYWNQDGNQQDAFVAEFAAFMERIFSKHFDQIKTLKLSCRDEEIQGSMAKVVTNLSTSGEEFVINFRMHQHDSGWKIYDVMLENGSFSLIRNYRTQLQWILQSSSFEQLLRMISEKR